MEQLIGKDALTDSLSPTPAASLSGPELTPPETTIMPLSIRDRIRSSPVVVALAMAATLSACSSGNRHETIGPVAVTEASPAMPSPSPTVSQTLQAESASPAPTNITVTATFRTVRQYLVKTEVTIDLGTATVDTANASPGQADVTLPIKLAGLVENQSPGHILPYQEIDSMELAGLFPRSSAVCRVLGSEFPHGDPTAVSLASTSDRTDVCSVQLGYDNGDSQLEPSKQYASHMALSCNLGPRYCAADEGATGNIFFKDIKESQAQAFADALSAGPETYALAYGTDQCMRHGFGTSYLRVIAASPHAFSGCII